MATRGWRQQRTATPEGTVRKHRGDRLIMVFTVLLMFIGLLVIYAIGLLHDIGRVEQYEKGIGHHIASFNIAKEILKDIDFKEEEKWIKELIAKVFSRHLIICTAYLVWLVFHLS